MSIETKELSITEELRQQAIEAHKLKHDPPVEPATVPPVDYKALYKAQQEETDRLNAIITSARIANSAPVNKSHKPAVTCARLRATLGDAVFHGMSRTEKLVGLGVDPKISDDTLHEGWGRGNDGRFAADLMKTDPAAYGRLREAAIALNIFGAKKKK